MADHKRIEKQAKIERKKLLKTPIKHKPMAMQPLRKDDDVTDSRRDQPGADGTPRAGALVTPPKLKLTRNGCRAACGGVTPATAQLRHTYNAPIGVPGGKVTDARPPGYRRWSRTWL
jgi:hypothetical protein